MEELRRNEPDLNIKLQRTCLHGVAHGVNVGIVCRPPDMLHLYVSLVMDTFFFNDSTVLKVCSGSRIKNNWVCCRQHG